MSDVVRITALAAGGNGVGRLADGMTVFVPRTAPGDTVRLRDVRRHRRHAEGRVADLVTAGPDRVEPVCPHVTRDRCGGCQWQHLAAGAQQQAKRRIVGDALRRIGRLAVDDPELVPSPRALAYRTVVTLTVRRRGDRVFAGFHDGDAPDAVFPLDRCLIARAELQRLWEALRDHLGTLPPGDDVRLRLRVTDAGGLHVVVSGGDRAFADGGALVAAAHAAGLAVTVWWQPDNGAPRVVGGAAGDAADVAFGQVNAEVAATLQQDVVAEALRGGAPARVVDLYAGAGQTALPLAAAGAAVTLIEQDPRAVRRAQEQARAGGLELRAIAGRVEDHLSAITPGDTVIANPPRAGLGAVVTAHLAACPPRRLVYVSCDPATLARDLARLRVTAAAVTVLRAYDMFPQTAHVETLVVVGNER